MQEYECGIPQSFQMRPGSSVGQNASLSRQRSGVRVPFGSPELKIFSKENIFDSNKLASKFVAIASNKEQKANSLSKERRYASVAQLVEQGTENPRVVGSIPTGGTKQARRVITKCSKAYFLVLFALNSFARFYLASSAKHKNHQKIMALEFFKL